MTSLQDAIEFLHHKVYVEESPTSPIRMDALAEYVIEELEERGISGRETEVRLNAFAGVGTTLAVAEGLNRNAIGFELNEEYINYFEEHTRPNVVKEMKTEQQKFFDAKRETQRRIWTPRVHKYAFKLYRQLMEDLGEEGADDGVNTIPGRY